MYLLFLPVPVSTFFPYSTKHFMDYHFGQSLAINSYLCPTAPTWPDPNTGWTKLPTLFETRFSCCWKDLKKHHTAEQTLNWMSSTATDPPHYTTRLLVPRSSPGLERSFFKPFLLNNHVIWSFTSFKPSLKCYLFSATFPEENFKIAPPSSFIFYHLIKYVFYLIFCLLFISCDLNVTSKRTGIFARFVQRCIPPPPTVPGTEKALIQILSDEWVSSFPGTKLFIPGPF